jgi:hypothetical protein
MVRRGFCLLGLAVGQRRALWSDLGTRRNEANGSRGQYVRLLRLDGFGISALWQYLRTLLQRLGMGVRVAGSLLGCLRD